MSERNTPTMSDIDARRARLRRLLRGKDAALLSRRPPAGAWSVLENVRHLLFAEQLHLGAFLPGKVEWSALGLTGMRAARFATVGTRKTSDVAEVFAEWDAIHRRIRTSMKSASGPEAQKALWRNERHLRIHTDVIERVLRTLSSPRDGRTASR